ncbi:MAG: hypothetical protein DHS20C14_22600 [Phycisphaeraceae bacterium]|nr:MAG: hypothetical protein DHS20C14_22600 [Phycisphaeraceae bacterium]
MDLITHYLTVHYGLDWAAGLFMILSMWRLGAHKRDGFIHGLLAAVFWLLFNIKVDSPPGIAINAVVAVLAVRSWFLWHRSAPPKDAPPADA